MTLQYYRLTALRVDHEKLPQYFPMQVTMVDKEGAEKACANPNPVVDGRRANVNLAYLGAKPKNHSQPGRFSRPSPGDGAGNTDTALMHTSFEDALKC